MVNEINIQSFLLLWLSWTISNRIILFDGVQKQKQKQAVIAHPFCKKEDRPPANVRHGERERPSLQMNDDNNNNSAANFY